MITDTHTRSEVVLASAGTGKTFRLTMRFIALLAAGHDPGRILVTTFTRAAAGEIGARILRLLALAALDASETDVLKDLRSHAVPDLTRQRCAELVLKLAASLHRLRIQTIDSFFARCAAGFALDLELPPGWRMLDDSEDSTLRDESVEQIVLDQGGDAIIALLEAVTAGKAESRVEHPLRDAVNKAYTVWLDAPHDAWWQSPHVPRNPSNHEVTEILRKLADHPCPTTKSGSPRARWSNALISIREIIEQHSFDDILSVGLVQKFDDPDPHFDRVPIDSELIEMLSPIIECAKHRALWRVSQQNQGVRAFLGHFDTQYRRMKHAAGGVVFDDVPRMLKASGAMQEHGLLAYRLDGAIDHVMIDEAQDTSVMQYALLQELIDEILSAGGVRDRTVCIVGDVKQSLYGWRNAEPDLLAALPDRWPQLVQESMSRSFRSSPIVIDAVNAVFDDIAQNSALSGQVRATERWQSLFEHHETARTDLPGWSALIEAPKADPADQENDDDGNDTAASLGPTDRIALDRVTRLCQTRQDLTIGLLFRSNNRIAPMVHALRSRGVPACEHRGNPLTDTPVIAAILSLILLSEHPGHTAAAYHLTRTPLGTIIGLSDHADRRTIGSIGHTWRRRFARKGYAGALADLTDKVAPHTDARGMQRFRRLLNLAERADQAGGMRALDFLDMIISTPVEAGTSERVRVMTIHASKGLEFDAVYLPELDSKWSLRSGEMATLRPSVFDPPAAVSLYASKDVREFDPSLSEIFRDEESRRVRDGLCALYVAMTRARCSLEMIVSPLPKSQSETISAARILHAALGNDQPPENADHADHSIIWSLGDPDWHTKLAQRMDASEQSTAAQTRLTIRLAPQKHSAWIRARRSPSSLEGAGRVRLSNLLRTGSAGALDYGTLIHLWFSLVEWSENATLTPEDLIRAAQGAGLSANDAVAEAFLSMLMRPGIRRVLSRDRCHPNQSPHDRLIVRREYPFVRKDSSDTSDAIMSGQIDRLVLGIRDDVPAWGKVIDFKTDAVKPDDESALAERVRHYQPQMMAYRSAAAEILRLPLDRVNCSLVFTALDRAIDPFADG